MIGFNVRINYTTLEGPLARSAHTPWLTQYVTTRGIVTSTTAWDDDKSLKHIEETLGARGAAERTMKAQAAQIRIDNQRSTVRLSNDCLRQIALHKCLAFLWDRTPHQYNSQLLIVRARRHTRHSKLGSCFGECRTRSDANAENF